MSAGDKKILASLVKKMKQADEDPLSHLIDRYLIERELPKNRHKRIDTHTISLKPNVRPLGRISPSSIGGCQRQAVLKFLGVEGQKRISPESQLIFEDGHWRHHKWQAIAIEMEQILGSSVFQCLGIERAVQFQSLYVAGALDIHCAIADRDEMIEWVIDIKGINKFGFNDIVMGGEPKEAHVLQLLSYMRAQKVRRGMLLYDCKDDQRTKIFTIRFSAQQWTKVSEWCEGVISDLKYEQLPPVDSACDNGTMLYERCPYRKLCFGRYTGAQLERMAYSRSPGVDALWKEGLRLEQEG